MYIFSVIIDTTAGHPMAQSNRADALYANTSLQARNSSSHICFTTNEEEKDTRSSLNKIERNFTSLMVRVNRAFTNCVTEKPDSLSTIKLWLKKSCYMTDHASNSSIVTKIPHANTAEEIFDIICPLYDYIDCDLIMDMCEEFIPEEQELANELSEHHEDAENFYSSTTIEQLKKNLENLYQPYLANDITKMPKIIIKLHNRWSGIKMKGLKRLIEKMLPLESKQSILQYIEIIPGSITIHYYTLDFTADSLIEYTGGKLQFMRLIGIFSLYINDHSVLQGIEDMNFTFELALLEAVTAGNNEAVEFLLQLETVNIDHTNEEGKTALMLASERGQEDIVHSLLSAVSLSQDPFVKRELTKSKMIFNYVIADIKTLCFIFKGDHGRIMGLIDKDIDTEFEKLAVQFSIPQGTIKTIAYNNRNNSAWHGLNDVVTEWLQGNTTVYDEGDRANVKWLYDAVRTINKDLGTKIVKGIS